MPLGLVNKWNAAHAAKKAEPKPASKPKPAKAQRAAVPPKQPLFVATSPQTANQGGGGGAPMPLPVRSTIEKSLQVDLGAVRVHTDASAHTANKNLSARAFTYGNHIFLGQGENPANVGLMAHEAAHVVQQRGAPKVQRWSSRNSSDACEHEAHRASAAVLSGQTFSVNERTTSAKVQRFGISDLVDYFADKANNIPGYRMFTLIIGVNPINMETVERTPANIFRAAIELIPGGKLITDVLEKHGLLEKGANWVATQFKKLAMVGEAFIKAIEDFIDDLGWSDLLHPFRLWERAKRIVLDPVEKIIDFVVGLVDGIIELIKKAILIPLAKLAEGSAGWDLLCAVLGKNPITGDPVPRTAETLIGGFMKLIHQEEIWENIKKANALSKAWAWFNGAVDGLIGFVKEIPSLFIQALKDLELVDILVLPKAFIKIGKVFLGFVGRFFSWAGEQVWSLLEIIFSVVAPSVVPYLKKAAAAFRTILKNPIGFVGNLVKAGKQGFQQFASNFLTHLKAALIGWLTGTLEGANIYIPQGFSFMEIVKFVLSVLGLTWENIRQKLVKAIGETAVKALETGFELVKTMVTQGPAAAWEQIQKGISNLKEMVMDGITSFVKSRIVTAAITKLVTMLNPAGAFIQAIIAIYNTIMFFIERLRQIGQVVAAFIDSISAIANGIIGAAANKVEATMERLLVLVISFLARFAGLGNVSEAIQGIVKKIRDPIDKALDKVVDWIVAEAKRLGKAIVRGVTGGRQPAPSPAAQPQAQPAPLLDPARQQALDQTASAIDALIRRQAPAREISGALAGLRSQYHWTALDLKPRSNGGFEIQGGFSPVFTLVSTANPMDPRFVIMEVSNITTPAPSTTTPLKFEQGASFLMVSEILPALFPRTTVQRRKERVPLTVEDTEKAVARARPGEALVYNEPKIPSVAGGPRSRTGVSYPDVFVLSKNFAISIEVTLRSQWNVDEVVPGEAGARIHKGAQAPSLALNLGPHLAANPSLQLLLTIVSNQAPDARAQQWVERFLSDKASGRVIGFVWLVVPSR